MKLSVILNAKPWEGEMAPETTLLDFLRAQGLASVKRGCDSESCGLCTVWVEGKPVLSCSYLACRAQGKRITTLEGVGEEAAELGRFLAERGAEQCGFCASGFLMTVLALRREITHPTREAVGAYLAGNLCRCSGYTSQMDAVCAWLGVEA